MTAMMRRLVAHTLPMGTEILVPDAKYKWDRGNPTGHNVIFITLHREALCFVTGTGI